MNNASPSSSTSDVSSATRDLITRTLNANQVHQYALTKYAERLTEELKEVDALLKVAERETQEDVPLDEDIQIRGAVTAKSPIIPADLLKTESPFYEEATSRNRYVSRMQYRPMKGKELDTLVSAVIDEFRRLRAIDYRNRGLGIPDKSEPVDLDGDTENINWSVVAEKVSDVATFKRMPDECKVKWLGHKQPRLNHSEWGEEELQQLFDIVRDRQQRGKVDWVEVAAVLGTNRVPIDCMKNGISRPRQAWTVDADKRLIEAVELYGHNNWGLCAVYVSEHCTPSQCYARYTKYLDPKIDRSEWTAEEDTKLRAAVAMYGPAWKEITMFIPGRTNEQCRERFTVVSSGSGKRTGTWDAEEDRKLLEGVSIHGNKWKLVSAHLQNTRSHAQCRNHYAQLQKTAGTVATSSRETSVATSAPSLVKGPPRTLPQISPNDFLVLAPPTIDTTTTSGDQISQPPRKQSSKVKGKAKAKTPPTAAVDPTTTSVEMEVDMPTSSNVSTSQSTRPRPRPIPKVVAATTAASTSTNTREGNSNSNASVSGTPLSGQGEDNTDRENISAGTTVTSVGTRQSRRLADKKAAAASGT